MKQHNKPGFILFLLFIMLSVCTILISIFFSHTMIFNQLYATIRVQKISHQLNISASALIESLLNTSEPSEKKTTEASLIPSKNSKKETQDNISLFKQIFPFLNKSEEIQLTSKENGIDALVSINLYAEQGKLNINSLYDFEKKNFLYTGTDKDKKKLCTWLFTTIATITKKPSLLEPFEKYLKNRDCDLNDVTELLSIKEFADVFDNALFITETNDNDQTKLWLTDIFTVSTEQETINPWLFSPSWQTLLQLKPNEEISEEAEKKLMNSISKTTTWTSEWDAKLKDFYKKEFKDIPTEIKTMLTTDFEANIFSLLLTTNIAETNSSIFTIVKMKAKDDLIYFEPIKNYQI